MVGSVVRKLAMGGSSIGATFAAATSAVEHPIAVNDLCAQPWSTLTLKWRRNFRELR